jgi:N-methylhydantoinase A
VNDLAIAGAQTAHPPGRYRLGIDIGGTFTDLLLVDEVDGRVVAFKTASTPSPEDAVIDGITELKQRYGVDPAEIVYFSHGTTLGVNTLLQRNGDRVGVLITKGFRDTLELRRLRLPKTNDFFVAKPLSLVPRRYVLEIQERLLADGSVLLPLSRDDVESQARQLYAEGIRNIAVCFLHAYRNDAHERQARAWIEALLPDVYVCTSAEIWPQQREYERFLISVINGYIGARMQRYFATLQQKTAALGLRARTFSTKSNGGVMSLEAAAARPVQTLLSGPAAGVIGANAVGRQIGDEKLVTLDMGGTSADVAIIDGAIPYATENTVGDFPVIMPAVDVSAVGAGGGSIAWINPEGVLKVGPHSAGAHPGPACYGRDGEDATVTDAYLIVGICSPSSFLGGQMQVYPELARAAIGRLAERLGLGLPETADAILQIATANIYAGLIPQIARRGVDASEFSLLPYGAAGPTHSFMVAREIAFRRIIVPPTPGLLCALGCLVADLRADFVTTVWRDLAALTDADVQNLFAGLASQAGSWLEREAVDVQALQLRRSADLCYVGQSFELNVPLPDSDAPVTVPILAEQFHERHQAVYGHADRSAPVRLLETRTQIVGVMHKPAIDFFASRTAEAISAPPQQREILDRGERVLASVVQRSALAAGTRLDGPLVVEQYDTTCYVPPGFRITVDERLNLIGERA